MSIRFLTNKWEAAQNILWVSQDETYNVVAIFSEAEECKLAAAALNAYEGRESTVETPQ